MTHTVFIDTVTPIVAAWLNDVDAVTYTTVPALPATLALKAPLASPTFTGAVGANTIQIGNSPTATQNFVLTVPSTPNGTINLSRGNVGVTTQDVLTIDANGIVRTPANLSPCFSAWQSAAQTLATTTFTKLNFQTKEFDTTTAYDNVTNMRFQPLVSGYYQVFGAYAFATTACYVDLYIYKNGVAAKEGANGPSALNAAVSALVFLNGTTDYLELFGYLSTGQAILASNLTTFFQAALVQRT